MSNEYTPNTEKPKRSAAEVRRDIQATRRELAETLDALEYKLDIPARFAEWKDDSKARFVRAQDEEPVKVYGIIGGAVLGIASIITGISLLGRRND